VPGTEDHGPRGLSAGVLSAARGVVGDVLLPAGASQMTDGVKPVDIAGRVIGPGRPTFIVAEMSANHGRSLDKALEIIDAASRAGADAVKLQTYTADTLTLEGDQEWFYVHGGTPWDGRRLYDLYQEAATPWEWFPLLQRRAEERGIILFSTAFDPTAVDFLEAHQVPCHKVASFELVDLPLIERMAATGKPLIMSTGMADLAEIDAAVRAARGAGARDLILMYCNSAYPAPPAEMNLRTMAHLAAGFGLPVGLSDHTLGIEVAVAAVALGASVIEKHFTLSRAEPGPDSSFSIEPEELGRLVASIRVVEQALGGVSYGPTQAQRASLALRRSLFVVADVARGEVLTADNVRSLRPALGLAPRHLPQVLGRAARQDIKRGTPMSWDLIEPPRAAPGSPSGVVVP
jgi:pseudaminic acid synthase